MTHLLKAAVTAAIAVAATIATVVAASAATIEVGSALGAYEPYANAVVSFGALLFVGFLLWQLKTRFNIEIDAGHRDTIIKFVANQASSLVAKGFVAVKDAKIEIQSEALASAANAALKSAPDALNHFGLTPDALKSKIEAAAANVPAIAAALAEAHKE